MSRRTALAAGLLLIAACGDPVTPERRPAYRFDYFGDVFRWPLDRLPVRFFATPQGNMRLLVQRAIGAWEDQFLYGEFRGVLVGDSLAADVIVLWADSVPPDVPPDPGPPVRACDGVTSFTVDATNTIERALHVVLDVSPGYTTAQVAACMRRTAIHELGHTLGLLQHSPNATDIMAVTPLADVPSLGDRRTAEVLYHTPPTIRPPPL